MAGLTVRGIQRDVPPYAADTKAPARLKKLGVEPGKPFQPSESDLKTMNSAIKRVQKLMAKDITELKGVNNWVLLHNLGRYGTDYQTRAGVALIGLGADRQEDTIYPSTFRDSDGKFLDCANKYVMHFEPGQLPPTNATWSVSQYQGNFYVRNSINRYAIAPWMPLKFNPDGSLDIYFQSESPGPDKESNWLPVPSTGLFNVSMRNYWPKEEAMSGAYEIPPIRRVK